MPNAYFAEPPEPSNVAGDARRAPPIEGGRNFRDMGGYRADDGRTVRWGRLFRSGSMAHLSDDGRAYLRGLDIRAICDLRDNHERQREATGLEVASLWGRDYRLDLRHLSAVLSVPGATAETMREVMAKRYENTAYDHAESYRWLFERLLAGETPMLFNCSAGKDRTGVAAALILTALGVPRDTVLADYVATDHYLDAEAAFGSSARDDAPATGLLKLFGMRPDLRRQMMRADPLYLESAFSTMVAREGSVEGFLEARLDLSQADLQRLRDDLLETPAAVS